MVTPKIGTTLFAPGWHEGRSMTAYLADPAVSASALWKLHQSTPAHFLHDLRQHEDDTTPAKGLGSLTHTKVFEPAEFDRRYVVLGPCEARLKSGERKGESCGKQGSIYRDGSSFCGIQGHDPYGKDQPQDPTIEAVTEIQREQAIAMDEALRLHHTARAILEAEGPREVIGAWKDERTGLWCRMRPDLLISDPDATPERYHWSVVNLKTTGKSASPGAFPRDAERLGYYFKAAYYRMGVRELWGLEPQNFLYPTVETFPPHEVIVYRLHEDALDIGEAEVRAALDQLGECVQTGRWPGYGIAVHNLTLPDWRLKMAHDIDFLEVA